MSIEHSDGASDIESRKPETVDAVATIMVEVRDTAGAAASRGEVEQMIRSRLERAGVELSAAEVADLATQLVEGDEPAHS
ncbi:hypothetical protein [Leucobacter tenebrionis]|uniref:hypothetical protein n=1 Tax=Leucobacter tenebrionis TaxID=2873270 RepID=UPI001CA6FE99|nr:hypothetical protein [Leucobacter tenebrionis]QZY52616.1 hypothetical protein KVY00_03930 [Leucobacter tenebrionis]